MTKIETTLTYTRPSADVPFYEASAEGIAEVARLDADGYMLRVASKSGIHPDDPLKMSFVTEFQSPQHYTDFQANQKILDEAARRNAYNEEHGITKESSKREYEDLEYYEEDE
jgi:hypothetical protein